MRSTPDEARLDAMASPLDVNSSVMLTLRDRAETYHVTKASGTSAATRNRTILPRRPSPGRNRRGPGAASASSDSSVGSLMGSPVGSRPNGRSPVGDGY